MARACKTTIATDIINFFNAEDVNLNIRFLTYECEKIPSPVHESEAMKDVYVLLHKSQADYNHVVERINVSDNRILTHEDMLESLRKEMKEGFKAVSDLIKDSMPVKVSRQAEDISVPLQENADPSEMSPPLVSEHITSVEEDVNLNESPDLVETKDAKETEDHLGVEDELEEGEIRDSPINENNATNVAIAQQLSKYRLMHQQNQKKTAAATTTTTASTGAEANTAETTISSTTAKGYDME